MKLLTFAHDIVIDSKECSEGVGVKRLLFLSRRHSQPLGVKQHVGQGGWPALASQLLHIEQFAQQAGIAQRVQTIVEFPARPKTAQNYDSKNC